MYFAEHWDPVAGVGLRWAHWQGEEAEMVLVTRLPHNLIAKSFCREILHSRVMGRCVVAHTYGRIKIAHGQQGFFVLWAGVNIKTKSY